MKDPLGLDDVATPEAIRSDRAAPLPAITNMHHRVVSGDFGDSLESKVALLAHMMFLAYQDLKDIQTK
jgi:hypothetical protein